MKKLVVVCLGIALIALVVPLGLRAEVGVKIGASFAKFSWTEPEPPGLSLGYLPFIAGGLYGTVNLGSFAFQPELLVVRTGGRYASEGDSLEFRFTYIQIPLLLRLDVLRSAAVRPFLAAGGYGSYLYRAEGVLVIGSDRTVTDLIEEYQRYDFGLVASAGLAFKLDGFTISIEGRYDYGLVNILKYPAEGESMKNRCLTALVGIGF